MKGDYQEHTYRAGGDSHPSDEAYYTTSQPVPEEPRPEDVGPSWVASYIVDPLAWCYIALLRGLAYLKKK